MSNRAKYLGAAGTVIDGRLRDLQEHRDLEYPVSHFHEELCYPDKEIGLLSASQVFARDVGTTAPQEIARVSEVSEVHQLTGCIATPLKIPNT